MTEGPSPVRRRFRRRAWSVAAAVAVLVSGTAIWWFVWVPQHRPAIAAGEVYGIDVSAHQGTINWHAVARDDIAFAYVKASEGGDHSDARYDENTAAARAAGLRTGPYHFFTLCRSGAEQAEHFLLVAPPDPASLPPAVDLELAGNCAARPSEAAVDRELRAFVTAVESSWKSRLVFYVGDDREARYATTTWDRPRWRLHFLVRPDKTWHIWQLHGYARVAGIEGPVDLDVADMNRLIAATQTSDR